MCVRVRVWLFSIDHKGNTRVPLPAFLGGWRAAKVDDIPDMVIHPKDSMLVEVCGAELVPTVQFSAGWTLRFPRLIRLRDDKVCALVCAGPYLCCGAS